MKIVSANRSDIFDEYINIISKYNKKTLVKEAASIQPALLDVAQIASKDGAKITGDLLSASNIAFAKVTAEEVSKAGIKDLPHLNNIWNKLKQVHEKFNNSEIKFIVKDNSGWRIPTDAEIKAAEQWSQKNNNIDIQVGAFQPGTVTNIVNVTEDTALDVGKLLEDGTTFTSDAEKIEFAKISQKLLSEPQLPIIRPTDPSVIYPGNRSIVDIRNLAAIEQAKNSLTSFIDATSLKLSDAIKANQSQDAIRFITQLDNYFKRFDDLLKEEVKILKEENQRLLTETVSNLEDAIKSGNKEAVSSIKEQILQIESKIDNDFEKISKSLDKVNKAIENNEKIIAQSGSNISAKITAQTSQLDEFSKSLDNLKSELSELKTKTFTARSLLDASSLATTTMTMFGKLKSAWNFLSSALKIAAGLGIGYLAWNWYMGSESSEAGAESPPPGGTGRDETDIVRESPIAAALGTRESRADFFNRIEEMNPNKKSRTLNQIASYYNAIGAVELDNPVVVNNEMIKYVFPSRRRGGRLDSTRIEATKQYFSNVYANPENYGRLISRLQNESGSKEGQEIANYSFSSMAASGMFSGEGTFLGLGNRGKRYGRGKEIKSVSEKGLAGGGKRKMTRKEKGIAEEQALSGSVVSESDDFFSDDTEDHLYDDMHDPMHSFASGQEEYFTKISKNINISTNKINSYEFAKKADKISNRYFKDAVEDLEDDEFMKAYYAGFSKLHNQKPKKQKPDYEKLYDLHDETGAELIHKAHPKAISVAEAIGNGGLVENETEKSKAMEEVAFRVPSGNYRARYAFIQDALKKKS